MPVLADAQVLEAVEILLDGFESAEAPDDHLYQGVLSLALRLVFLLHAEDRGLMPMNVQGLYDTLVEDAGMHPESMHLRFGAYDRLLALFRAVFVGFGGKLFDPSSHPFLERSSAAIDDDVVHAVLERLVRVDGERVSYRDLDVEQFGSVYESLLAGEERRRSGSHYTPRSLTERIVRRTLEPILACLGPEPSEAQILSLRVCDPAMGSGAFLVEACRVLAEPIVAAWTRDGSLATIIEIHGDPHLHARRLVVQRCLYGVDKNEAAVELAKLSLWLVAMDREQPFTFVDHALRHGDSLVGLDLEQVSSFHWQKRRPAPRFAELMQVTLDQRATERIRLIADACVGTFFAEAKDKAREIERARRMAVIEGWLAGEERLETEVRAMAAKIREQHAPFHWWLEFPELFHGSDRMAAFIGNPPFMGVAFITEKLGPGYVAWLQGQHRGTVGKFDLSAHFFRRAAVLLGQHGSIGLIATNTIGQGDTRATGLKALVEDGWTIVAANDSLPWPGAAAVTVSVVHLARGRPAESCIPMLDEQPVIAINSRLRPMPERSDPRPLQANRGGAFVGSYVLGAGFILGAEERKQLITKSKQNAEIIFPYLGGQEVNTSPTQAYDRFIINFGTRSLAEAERWPDLFAILDERVRPEREKIRDSVSARAYKRYWWLFGRYSTDCYGALAALDRCLVTANVTKHLMFSFQTTHPIFAHTLNVFPLRSNTSFGILQSRIHECWARLLCSSLEDRLRYAASDCFDTFPFPCPDPRTVLPEVEVVGRAFYEARARFMVETEQGLTKTYNAMKDPHATNPTILELRRLTEAMDRTVLDAYGWTDLHVPPYCEADEAFGHEILDRLYVLNATRALEEE